VRLQRLRNIGGQYAELEPAEEGRPSGDLTLRGEGGEQSLQVCWADMQ